MDGTIRLLRNVMGLWLLQECRREWDAAYDELTALAAQARPDVALFDPDEDRFLRPGDMPARVVEACTHTAQAPPDGRGELVRSILTSLACKYRLVLERLELVTGRSIDTIHVIGGGARNRVLCGLTADITGRLVLAGPVEATALSATSSCRRAPPGSCRRCRTCVPSPPPRCDPSRSSPPATVHGPTRPTRGSST